MRMAGAACFDGSMQPGVHSLDGQVCGLTIRCAAGRRRRVHPGRSSSPAAVGAAAFVLRHADDGGQRVAFVEGHDPHALRVAADDADVAGLDPLDLAAGGHHQQLVGVVDADDADHRAVAVGGLDVAEALAAAVLRAVAEAGGRLRLRRRRRRLAARRLGGSRVGRRRRRRPASGVSFAGAAFGPKGVRLP